MNSIDLPYWIFLLLCLFAAIGLIDRVFAPSVRWFFHRRLNRAIEEVNDRLHLRIQPFKLTRRRSLIERLIYDPKIVAAVEAEALTTGKPRSVVMNEAERYAREIVPAFNMTAYFAFGTRLARWISEFVYRVRLGYSDDTALEKIDKNATVVFVMNHRSNMDYVLVTYLAARHASLSYAVGEWARIWLLQALIRSMGAYFIRRKSRNELYRKVLGRYVSIATHEGVTQAVFPEGGLTRDGKLNKPKLGLLSYMLEDFDPKEGRDLVFIPVGVNYDRVVEDRILTAKTEKEVTGRDFRVRTTTIFRFFWGLIKLRFAGRLYRYGYASVSFGDPVSLSDWKSQKRVNFRTLEGDKRFAAIEKLGEDLMSRIAKIIPVLPVSIASHLLLQQGENWIAAQKFETEMIGVIDKLESDGAHVHIPRDDRNYAVETAVRMLRLRHMIEEDGSGRMRANPREKTLLAYYANSIGHLLEKKRRGKS